MSVFYQIAKIIFIIGIVLIPFRAIGQEYDIEPIGAQQEFEWGVRSYNNGFYNESILSFTRAVAQAPESVLSRLWLARSYYAAGLPDAAVEQYRILVDNDRSSPYIRNRIETIDTSRNSDLLLLPEPQYVVAEEINGEDNGRYLFLRPAGIAVDNDINLYVASFASHEVLRFSVNGDLQRAIWKDRYRFDRPYSVLVDEEGILVSEFGKDRVVRFNRDGQQEIRFNRAGNNGQFAGPQYLAIDEVRNIYVSDWGNQRIVKVNSNGNFIFQFSRRNIPRRPLFAPTGIVYHNTFLYIANSADSTIVVSDQNGNYVRTIELPSRFGIEGLALFDTQRLLLATTDGIFTYNLRNETLTQIASVAQETITSLALDRNNTIYATDFNKNRILVLSPVDEIYGGLSIHTMSIHSNRFPFVEIDVSVKNRFGRPILGLQSNNFLLREGTTIHSVDLVTNEQYAERPLSLMIVIPMTARISSVSAQLEIFITELLERFGPEDQVGVVVSGTQAVLRLELGAPFVRIRNEITELIRDTARVSNESVAGKEQAFDSAIRVAASELLTSASGRTIMYIDAGSEIEAPFAQIDRQQLAQLLNTNSISFIDLSLADSQKSTEIDEFYQLTEAQQFKYAESNTINALVRTLRASYDGRYRLSYTSNDSGDFGRRYIPFSITASLYQRSGRDETGYYSAIRN